MLFFGEKCIIFMKKIIETAPDLRTLSTKTIGKALDNTPTADVRENVKGHIAHAGGKGVTQWFECSECGTPVDITDNFCRCCGADMRGDKHD